MSVDPAFVQIAASSIFATASATIAGTSLFIAYRQNFGWKPILLIISRGLRSGSDFPNHFEATLSFELWNRRKYPIVIRTARASFQVLQLDESLKGYEMRDGWRIARANELSFSDPISLEPNSHHVFSAVAPFKRRTLDDLSDKVEVEITFFDPRRNKHLKVRTETDFTFR